MSVATIPVADVGGKPVSAVPAAFFSAVAARFNLARGLDGVRVEVGGDGGLVVRLGTDEYKYRSIVTCEPTVINGEVTALVFRRRRVLCSDPDGDDTVVPVQACNTEAGT